MRFARIQRQVEPDGPLPNAVPGRRFDLAGTRLLTRPLISKVVA